MIRLLFGTDAMSRMGACPRSPGGWGILLVMEPRLPVDLENAVHKARHSALSRRGTSAEYIQIVEYESGDIDAVIRAANSVPVPSDAPKPTWVIVVRDRDRLRTYTIILCFYSYRDAPLRE